MTIYRLHNDIAKYNEVFLDIFDLKDQMSGLKNSFGEKNQALIPKLNKKWLPVPVTFFNENKNVLNPDICVWALNKLVLSDKAKEALYSQLSTHGEFLELQEGYHLFNCLASVAGNSIDPDKTAIEIESEDSVHNPKSLSFVEEEVEGLPLFKPGFLQNSFFLCSEEFKNTVENANLGGIRFSETLADMFGSKSS